MRSTLSLRIILIALLVLALIILVGVVNRLNQVVASLPRLVESELETRLSREARVGTARYVAPGTLIATDIAVANGRTFRQGAIFTAKQVVMRVSIVGLALGRGPLARNTTRITLVDPALRLERNRQGVWNIEDLLRRVPVPAERRFRGRVFVRSGRLTVVDHAADLPRLPAVNALRAVQGNLDFADAHSFLVNLEGRGPRNRVRTARASGRWAIDRPVHEISLTVTEADARYWLDYFTNIRNWGLGQGTFSGTALLTQRHGAGIVATGRATLRDSSVTSPHLTIPVRPFAASIRFVGTDLTIDGRGRLRQSPVTLRGRILGFTPGRLDLRVNSDRLDLDVVQRAVRPLPRLPNTRWPAPGKLSGAITGTTANPEVTATLTTPRAVIVGRGATDLAGQGYYRNGIITVARLTGRAAGGQVRLTSKVYVRTARITAAGTADGINLTALSIPFEPPIRGMGDFTFTLDYLRGLRTANMTADIRGGGIGSFAFNRGRANIVMTGLRSAQARISIGRATAPGAVIERGSAELELRGRRIAVRRMTFDTLRGVVTATGTATTEGRLDLRVSAADINLPALLRPLGYEQLTGTADFTGSLTGTTSSPRLEGTVTARNGTLRGAEYDFLSGRLIATRQFLVLENTLIRREEAEVVTSGRITVARGESPQVELGVTGRRVRLGEVFGLLGIPVEATGVATADLRVSGRYPNLLAEGDISARDATIAGVPVDEAAGSLRAVEGHTVITRLFARREDMQVVGTGTLGPGGEITASLRGDNLRLSLLNPVFEPFVVLSGPVTFEGSVVGTLRQPTISGTIESISPTINAQPFDRLTTGFMWSRERLTVSQAALKSPSGAYAIRDATYNQAQESLELHASAETMSIAGILPVLRNSPALGAEAGQGLRRFLQSLPEPFTGTLNASVDVAGRVNDLRGNVSLAATNVPLDILGPLVGLPTLTGTADFTLRATGTTEDPSVEVSFAATDVATRQFRFETVSADRLIIAGGRLTTDRLTAVSRGNRIFFSGALPFNRLPPFIPRDQPIQAHVELPDQDLSILEVLIGVVEHAAGTLSMNLDITGTIADPMLTGQLTVTDGALNLSRFESDFTNLQASATFEEFRLVIRDLTGASSLGGTFSVSGNIAFPDLSSAILTTFVTLNDLKLSATNVTGVYGEEIRMSASGQLTVTDALSSPLVEGQLVVSDAHLEAPAGTLPPLAPIARRGINPRFAMTINLARDVQVERGPLLARVVGPVSIGGSLAEPEIAGTVSVVSGRLNYVGRRFDLVPGGAATLVFMPPESKISVDVLARTRITAPSPISGRLTRYTVTLDISGPINEPDIDVTSSPPGLSREQALGIVFRPAQIEALLRGEPFESVLRQQLPGVLLGTAFPTLFEGFETGPFFVAIEPGFAVPLTLAVSTALTPKVSLTYSRAVISNEPFDTLGLSYSITPRFELSAEFEEQTEVTYLLQYGTKF